MIRRKKKLALLLAIMMTFSMLAAACTGDAKNESSIGASSKGDGSSQETPENTGLSGKLSIWSWGADAEKAAREDMVKVFIENHPELEVEHVVLPTADSVWDQKSTAALAAGTAGDIMQMSPDYYGLMTDYYEDLNPYVQRDEVDLDQVITAGMMDGYYRPSGKLEAMPLLANCFVYAYNKDLFDAAGVEYPTDDWTWSDAAEMAPKFVKGEGIDHTYFIVNHWVIKNFATIAMGGVPYSDDFKEVLVGSQEVAEGLDLFGEFVRSGAMPDDVAAKNMPKEQLFVSGKAAIFPVGGFETGTISAEIGDNFQWDVVLPPKDTKGVNTNVTYATGYAMNTASQNKEAAWQFLKEMSYESDEMGKVTAKVGMPSSKKIAESDYAAISYGPMTNQKYVEGLSTSRLNLWGGALASAGDQFNLIWESVTVNGTAAKDAQAEYLPLVEQAWKELNIQ